MISNPNIAIKILAIAFLFLFAVFGDLILLFAAFLAIVFLPVTSPKGDPPA